MPREIVPKGAFSLLEADFSQTFQEGSDMLEPPPRPDILTHKQGSPKRGTPAAYIPRRQGFRLTPQAYNRNAADRKARAGGGPAGGMHLVLARVPRPTQTIDLRRLPASQYGDA